MKNIILIVLLLVLIGCSDKNKQQNVPFKEVKSGVFICNEGNFMYGNASLSVYDNVSGEVQNSAFYNVNNIPLGDVCQSMTIIENKGFVVVNGSGKVVVIDVQTLKQINVISDMVSPRYVLPVAQNKAYISSLQAPYITIIDPNTLEIKGKIDVGTSTEQMVIIGDFAYTTQWSYGTKVYKIDTKTDKVVALLDVVNQPNSITVDKNGKIWVLSDGGYEGSPMGQTFASLAQIDPNTFKVEKTFLFADMSASPSEITTDVQGENLLYLNSGLGNIGSKNGIFKMSVDADELPTKPFITKPNALFYALGVDPYNGDIYASDAVDYSQKGSVTRFYSNGNLVQTFKTDISSGSFCFFKRN